MSCCSSTTTTTSTARPINEYQDSLLRDIATPLMSNNPVFTAPFIGDLHRGYSDVFRLSPLTTSSITVTTPDLLPTSTHLLFSKDITKTRTEPTDVGTSTVTSRETSQQRSYIRPAWSLASVVTKGGVDELESTVTVSLDSNVQTSQSTTTKSEYDESRLGFKLKKICAIPIGTAYNKLNPSLIADVNYIHGEQANVESSVHAECHSTDSHAAYHLRFPSCTATLGVQHDALQRAQRAFVGGTHVVWKDNTRDLILGTKITSLPFLTQFQHWDRSPIIPVTSPVAHGKQTIPFIESLAISSLFRDTSQHVVVDGRISITPNLHFNEWHVRARYEDKNYSIGLQVGVPPAPADIRTSTTLAHKLASVGTWPLLTGDLLYSIDTNNIFRARISSDQSLALTHRRNLSPTLSVTTGVNMYADKGEKHASLGVGVIVG